MVWSQGARPATSTPDELASAPLLRRASISSETERTASAAGPSRSSASRELLVSACARRRRSASWLSWHRRGVHTLIHTPCRTDHSARPVYELLCTTSMLGKGCRLVSTRRASASMSMPGPSSPSGGCSAALLPASWRLLLQVWLQALPDSARRPSRTRLTWTLLRAPKAVAIARVHTETEQTGTMLKAQPETCVAHTSHVSHVGRPPAGATRPGQLFTRVRRQVK